MVEFGGGQRNGNGLVQIICNEDYTKAEASFIPSKGELACGKHAFIRVTPRMYVIRVERCCQQHRIEIYRIESTNNRGSFRLIFLCDRQTTDIFNFNGHTELNYPLFLSEELIKVTCVAILKSYTLNCRSPYYVVQTGFYEYLGKRIENRLTGKDYEIDSHEILNTPLAKLVHDMFDESERYWIQREVW